MYNFELNISTDIHFGIDGEKKTGVLMAPFAKNVLLVYGSERIFKTGLGNEIVESLEKAGCSVVKCGGVKPNAETEYIQEAAKIARENQIDGILAVGGGSVIDSAKAIAVSAYSDADVLDIYMGKAEAGKVLPIGAVVTVPATASESNFTSVIADCDTHQKFLGVFPETAPKFAILNPELTLTASPYQTAVGGFDIFSHAFERYFDLSRNSAVLDSMTLGLMKSVVEILPRLVKEPSNLQYRSDIMLAATVAHNDMLGPGGDFACHSISHEITTSYGVPHGAALAMIVPAWCEYLKDTNSERFSSFFQGVFGASDIEEGIVKLKDFVCSIGLSLNLVDEGKKVDKLADIIFNEVPVVGSGFKSLTKEDVTNICKKFIVTVA